MKSRRVVITIVVGCGLFLAACQTAAVDSAATMAAAASTIAATQPGPTTAASLVPRETPVPVNDATTAYVSTAASAGAPSSSVIVCDDFDDGSLDPHMWLKDDIGLITEADGVLNFQAHVGAGNSQTLGASVTLQPVGRAVSEVSFDATLISYSGNVPAGVGVELTQANGRDLAIDLGPGPQGPDIEISVCPDTGCTGAYEEYQHYQDGRVEVGKSMQFRIVWNHSQVKFYVNDILQHEQSLAAFVLLKVKLYLYADPGSDIRVAIDNFCVTYAG